MSYEASLRSAYDTVKRHNYQRPVKPERGQYSDGKAYMKASRDWGSVMAAFSIWEKAEAEKQQEADAARQRAAAEASLQQAQTARAESQEKLRLTTEQTAQDENKRNANDPNAASLRGLGFGEGGEGDGGGSAMTELTGLGGVGPDNLPLGKRKLLGGR